MTRKIEHSEPSLTITDEQSSAMGKDKAVRAYTTAEAKEISYTWMGAEVHSTAHRPKSVHRRLRLMEEDSFYPNSTAFGTARRRPWEENG